MDFSFLEKAKVALNHLDSSSAIHTDPFAAIAELVDNSYDAQAKNFRIDWRTQRVLQEGSNADQTTLEFLDDGTGMSRKEALNVISFGHSEKSASHIGRYGIGLKAGAFHLGREFLLLTKKDGIHTIMMISHKFHQEYDLKDSVFVPCPSFDQNFRPYFDYSENPSEIQRRQDIQRHEGEMELIQRFAPYGNLPVRELFRKIPTDSGTMIIVDRLRRSLSGEHMLDTQTDDDIRCRNEDLPPHEISLRKFLEILYLKPKMKIHLRGKPVVPTKICQSWMAKYRAEVPMKTFKDVLKRSELEREAYIKGLENDRDNLNVDIYEVNLGEVEASEIHSKTKDMIRKRDALNKMIEEVKKDNDIHQKTFKTSTITFFIGVQTEDRANNGIHFYANNRLVKWGHKATPFFKNKENSKKHIGISAYVDLDASTWIPTASKQALKAEDMTVLTRKCNEKLNEHFEYFETHWIRKNFGLMTGDDTVERFWNLLGYKDAFSARSSKEEVTDAVIAKLISKECPKWYICSFCGVWRRDVGVRVTKENQIITCRTFDNNGCNGVLESGDDEQFNMDRAKWAQIQLQMQRDKERADRRLAAVSVTSNSFATSTPSTSMTYPNSILKKPATGGSPADLRAVKPEPSSASNSFIDILDDFAVSPPRETRESARRSLESTTTRSTANRSRAVIESDSDHEQEFMNDVDMEVNPEDITPDPEPDYSMEDDQMDDAEDPMEEDEEEEEESLPRRRDPKPQASRPMTKVSRRRPISSDEEVESDGEVAAPSKKSKESTKDGKKASGQKKKFNRVEVLENAINALRVECGMQPLPKKGEFDLDLVGLISRPKAAADAERERFRRQKELMEENAATVLEYLGTQPYTGINLDRKLPTLDRFHDVARQLKEKNNKKKRQPKKK
ncbi:hypothetical protein CAEBREN_07659 [Caenorhabditis brenneri]|uniref:Morc S5 domain-containing protein n=1 Tax=Caenorhabditis brenneri TaxID=135651 RepID=G0P5E5_CAEBE|nr:hypothetical protein CAEBREN_07659 [Caenorhabditis brenneri]